MMATPKMVCKKCDVEMNHHAEKLVDPINRKEAAQMNPDLGGLIEEIHSCPDCGESESRRGG